MKTICGPKLSMCCTLLSTWGLIMLLILGGMFRVNAVAFIEDIGETSDLTKQGLEDVYKGVSNNCFIAAGIYLFFLLFSSWQYVLGKSGNYQVS